MANIDENKEYNYNALRFDILNFFDGAFMMGIPGAKTNYDYAENASIEELLKIADEYDFNMEEYIMPDRKDLWLAENKRIKIKE